jgi:prepilin-type N-terminal cleavage/methylation domain-containing protein
VSTETRGPRGERGFTLIEVLIAMVLLGIALMAIVPLGVISARQVSLADRNSRSAATATRYLEDALQQIRQGTYPAQCSLEFLNGDKVVREIQPGNNSIPAIPWRVTVTVTPKPTTGLPRPDVIRSYAFSPVSIPNEPKQPCPPQ